MGAVKEARQHFLMSLPILRESRNEMMISKAGNDRVLQVVHMSVGIR